MVTSGDDGPRMAGWRACDACGERPLASPADGLLSVATSLIDDRRAALAAHDAAADDPPPARAMWDWGHRECFPDRDPEHSLAGDRIDTLPKMMARTLDLLDTDWFADTAWEDAVRRFYAIPID
jgi:hypothetical protein